MKLLVVASFGLCLLGSSQGQERGSFLVDDSSLGDGIAENRYHATLQDHFDPFNIDTWQQGYFVNDTYWKGAESGAPVFLCVGGEGPELDATSVKSSVHCNNAVEWLEDTGALMVSVVHRFYTSNMSASPIDSLSKLENFKYLSASQALADLAMFHIHISKEYDLDPRRNRFIIFGGSYPGMLAAFARIKYPNLFYAAVSSSAPVEAQFEMPGYYQVVAEAYATKSVGGSEACQNRIRRGHQAIGLRLESRAGRAELEKRFGLENQYLESKSNQRSFCGLGVAEFPAQGNDPLCDTPGCNIASVCSILTSKDSPPDDIDALIKLRKAQGKTSTPQSRSVKKSIDPWEWQVCTEFGFLQTCEIGSKCIFTQGLVTLESAFHDQCQQFNITDMGRVEQLVKLSNNRYGGNRTDVERILWVNGSVDPWIANSVQNLTSFQKRHQQKLILVEGASHHAWTHPSDPRDQPTVIEARMLIRKVISDWLADK
mmetsp:Transcript_7099/g.11278  ORF Transcript_7099/g.11278 Transcript_7099/m.11278 type:complete len:485 (-) Transcript_7099:656-2110(-)|eukprot:CAMPEP_0203748862 /NCGR_PEP_ID=MMETSP0098-20131031/3627_1 /ASSEMBLY_ACC=CAM_ASM_000208 /TAXON_ID=96639 /ORGANISM=" , Strain NY0313808BC1" /LENGTH=484 /DNA_ID=CAMNT_0050637755 /DNA_START=205 /DNA_END=1659 /DNA_ORIENTATION=-